MNGILPKIPDMYLYCTKFPTPNRKQRSSFRMVYLYVGRRVELSLDDLFNFCPTKVQKGKKGLKPFVINDGGECSTALSLKKSKA